MSPPFDRSTSATVAPVLSAIRAQDRAVAVLNGSLEHPYHAYLFVGPSGTGKRDAALHMAAALSCPNGGCGDCPACRDVLAGLHPDVVVVERVGASISVEQSADVIALAQRSPRVGCYQIIVLVDFHLVGVAAPALLKTIEEPPDSTVFIVLADTIPPPLVTIASRCVEVEFVALDLASIEAILTSEGHSPEVATAAATSAHGSIARARLFAADAGFVERQARWRSVPDHLDGSGATIAVITKELLAGADDLVAVLSKRQDEEIEHAREDAERAGERTVPGMRLMVERHRREQRRVRVDELRAGLASLAEAYRSRLAVSHLPPRRLAGLAQSCAAIDAAASELVRNPNETLLIQSLLVGLDLAQ